MVMSTSDRWGWRAGVGAFARLAGIAGLAHGGDAAVPASPPMYPEIGARVESRQDPVLTGWDLGRGGV